MGSSVKLFSVSSLALGAVLLAACADVSRDDLMDGASLESGRAYPSDDGDSDAGTAAPGSSASQGGPTDTQEPADEPDGDPDPVQPDAGSDAGSPQVDAGPPPDPGSVDDLDDFSTEAINRVLLWVNVKMPYCGGPKNGTDYMYCTDICRRSAQQSNPEWDPYRTDCSGTVSFAWKLPPPGRITTDFAPYNTSVTTVIKVDELRPGDALNNETHIVLFGGWANKARTKARILEEYDCGKTAVDRIMSISINGATTVMYNGNQFHAIRYDKRPGFTPPP